MRIMQFTQACVYLTKIKIMTFYDVYDICRHMTFVGYDVCRIMMEDQINECSNLTPGV